MNGPLGSVPAIVIRMELERRPVIYVEAMTDEENARLNDWVTSHYDYLHLLDAAEALAA